MSTKAGLSFLPQQWQLATKGHPKLGLAGKNALVVITSNLQFLSFDGQVWKEHEFDSYSLRPIQFLSADQVFVVGDVKQAGVFSLADGALLHHFPWKPKCSGSEAALSLDGSTLAVLTTDDSLRIIDTRSGEERFKFEHKRPKPAEADFGGVAINANGSRAVSAWPGAVCFWDLEEGKLIKKQPNKLKAGSYSHVFVNPERTRAYVRAEVGVNTWEIATGKLLGNSADKPVKDGQAFVTRDRAWLYFMEPGEGTKAPKITSVRPYDGEDVKQEKRSLGGPCVGELTGLPPEDGVQRGIFRMWNLETRQLVSEGIIPADSAGMVVSPNGQTLFVGTVGALTAYSTKV